MYRESLPDAPEGGTIRLCKLQGIQLHTMIQCFCTCGGGECVSHHRVTFVRALDASPFTHWDQELHWPYRSPNQLTV